MAHFTPLSALVSVLGFNCVSGAILSLWSVVTTVEIVYRDGQGNWEFRRYNDEILRIITGYIYPVVAITDITIFPILTTTAFCFGFDLVSRGVFYGKFKSFGGKIFA